MTHVIVIFHFGLFLPPPNSPKNQKFKKMQKSLDIPFNTCVPKIMIHDVHFLRYGAQQTDRQTDDRKSDI